MFHPAVLVFWSSTPWSDELVRLQALQQNCVLVEEETNLESQPKFRSLNVVQGVRDGAKLLLCVLNRLEERNHARGLLTFVVRVHYGRIQALRCWVCMPLQKFFLEVVLLTLGLFKCVLVCDAVLRTGLLLLFLLKLFSHGVEQAHQVVVIRLLLQFRFLTVVVVILISRVLEHDFLVISLV